MNHVELANKILLLKEQETQFKPTFLSNELAFKMSQNFYKDALNQNEKELKGKIKYVFSKELMEYNGKCMITSINYDGSKKVTIILPEEQTVRKIITSSHEKAHAYHMLRGYETSEFIPSFIDILNSIYLDKEYPGIKVDNLNYKIRQAQKAAKVYLRYYKRKNVEDQVNYMTDFLNSLYLIQAYLSKKQSQVINEVSLQLNKEQKAKRIYTDDFEVEKAIEFIIKK